MEGEYDAVKLTVRWAERAGYLSKLEVLGFVDGGYFPELDSIGWL